MGRHGPYRPGSFYRQDDRTGFPQRAERTKKEWDNLIVDRTVWEERQPQDLVRGVRDDQSVPEARPIGPNTFTGPIYLQLTADVSPGANAIVVNDVYGVAVGGVLSVMSGSGDLLSAVASAIDAATLTITLAGQLLFGAPSGNVVIVYPGVTASVGPGAGFGFFAFGEDAF